MNKQYKSSTLLVQSVFIQNIALSLFSLDGELFKLLAIKTLEE